IATNVSIGAISTTVACLVWYFAAKVIDLGAFPTSTRSLIATVGIFAITQFVCGTLFATMFHSVGRGVAFWEAWKKDLFSTSMTQVVGAGIAGTVFEIVNFGDLITMFIAFATFGVVYFTYRQSIAEINSAINKVEEVEREKAQTERERRHEAE